MSQIAQSVEAESQPKTGAKTPRIESLDILRGFIVLVMLFVNDLAGVKDVPAWMKHVWPSTADGMTFVDVVFPAFLFIVGLSMPLALERRFAKGESTWSVARHVLGRSVSLLIIGVFMVNGEGEPGAGWLDFRIWTLLVYAGVCLVWMNRRVGAGPSARPSVATTRGGPCFSKGEWGWRRFGGVALLVALAFAFRGPGPAGYIELRPQWWGILGLIGWAYLVTGFLYLAVRRNELALAAAVPLLYCVYLADGAGFFAALGFVKDWVAIGSMLGSQAAITVSGALLGIGLADPARPHGRRIRSAFLLAAALASAAVLLHSLHGLSPVFYYSKNAATPPWCLLSSAWTAALWGAIYWMVQVRGRVQGTRTLGAAGQNALFAFILGPIAYAVLGLLASWSPRLDFWSVLGGRFSTGLVRSICFAAAATWVTAFLHRRRLTLRL